MASIKYKIGGFVLTFITLFMAMSNFTAYQNPEEASIIRGAFIESIEQQEKVFSNADTEKVYASFKANTEKYITGFRYGKSSLVKMIGSFIALIGTLFIRRKHKIGIHLFLGGMLFSIVGSFYWHGMGFAGWMLTFMTVIFTAVVGLIVLRKRNQFH